MKLLKIFILLMSVSGFSQASDVLSISYDAAGNQIVRELICISCDDPPGRKNVYSEELLAESTEHKGISYYPNPVEETLYLKWQNEPSAYVTSIEVYSVAGQMVYSRSNLEGTDTTSVAFGTLQSGYYSVLLVYSNGDQKDLKIIKK